MQRSYEECYKTLSKIINDNNMVSFPTDIIVTYGTVCSQMSQLESSKIPADK